jgi:branched-chain amino acid transport system substrate-binding protein
MSQKIKIIIGVVAVVVVIVLGLTSVLKNDEAKLDNDTGSTHTPIRIGAVLSLSGIATQAGESLKEGIELAKFDLKNQGVDVEIIYQDDKTEPKDTVSAINALDVQGVEAIIGPTWSFLGEAGVPVADRLQLVNIQPGNTSEFVAAKSPYAFFTSLKIEKITPTLTQWLKDNNKKKIAIITSQGAWYDLVVKAVTEAVANSGGEVVFLDTVQFGTEAASIPTVLAKLNNVNTDLIFSNIDNDEAIVTMLKKIKEQNITGDILTVTVSLERVLNEQLTARPNNKIYAVVPESSKVFIDKFTSFHNKTPRPSADRAYDSLMLLVEAIQQKGELPLEQYLRNETNYTGYAGQYKSDSNGDMGGGEWIIKEI